MRRPPHTSESYEHGGRSIAWVLKSSDKFVLGSCDVNPQKFESSGSHGDMNKVYVVLDQIGKGKEKELSFGLKIVNKQGKQLASESNNALIVTENSVGLINIQGWYTMNPRLSKGRIDSNTETLLKNLGINTEFQAESSEINDWLIGGSEISKEEWKEITTKAKGMIEEGEEGGWRKKSLTDVIKEITRGRKNKETQKKLRNVVGSKWFNKSTDKGSYEITVSAEWISWCGTEGNQYDKRLKSKEKQDPMVSGPYKNTSVDIDLRVGPIRNSEAGDKWALVPIGKPIMKINLGSGSFNNETIEGTLEPMKDDLSPFI